MCFLMYIYIRSVCVFISHFPGANPLLFAKTEVGSLTCIGCCCPIHGTDGL